MDGPSRYTFSWRVRSSGVMAGPGIYRYMAVPQFESGHVSSRYTVIWRNRNSRVVIGRPDRYTGVWSIRSSGVVMFLPGIPFFGASTVRG